MSLLLRALKQAEAANADKVEAGDRTGGPLDLEPLAAPRPAPERGWVEPPALLFGSGEDAPQPYGKAAFGWPRLSPVPLAGGLAALVALGYGIYLHFALQPPHTVSAPPVDTAAAGTDTLPPIEAAPVAPVEEAPSPRPLAQASAPLAEPPVHRPEPGARRAAPPSNAQAAVLPAPLQPDPHAGLLDRAYAAYQQGTLDEARRLYAQAAAHGRSIEALLGLAAIASVENREADAQRLYREVLALDPHHAAAQGALLDLAGNTDSQATETRLKMLIERDPDPQVYQTLGNLYAGQGRWHDAQAAYFEAYRAAPGNADYAFNLAVALDQLRQYPAARTYYEAALANGGAHRFDRAAAEARVRQLDPAR